VWRLSAIRSGRIIRNVIIGSARRDGIGDCRLKIADCGLDGSRRVSK
jgi:hypothetical protein